MRSRAIQKLRGLGRALLPAIAAAMPLLAPAEPALVDAARAQQIALAAAGCNASRDCVVKGGFSEGQWVFIVSFVHSRDTDGKPRFMPGGFVGVTVSADGRVIDRMPGV